MLFQQAGVSTVGEQAVNVLYAYGNPVDSKTVEALRKETGHTINAMLDVNKDPASAKAPEAEASGWAKTSFFF
ncbi:putative amino acid binding protein [Corchorus olitorius]|uniref:Amino acid binding protein n=1 Tax=Corchorus olitorius TaxID=93759 RepID=A0A1R3GGB5_9ROSI|nr:putative amino acid binding protein [Corchorus olitorius]